MNSKYSEPGVWRRYPQSASRVHVTHIPLANNVGGSGFSGVASAVTNTIAWGNGGYPGFAATSVITACTTGLPLDLDNKARPIGDRYDMGAYEGAGEIYIYLPLVLRNHTN